MGGLKYPIPLMKLLKKATLPHHVYDFMGFLTNHVSRFNHFLKLQKCNLVTLMLFKYLS
jgi:hypothetical protein